MQKANTASSAVRGNEAKHESCARNILETSLQMQTAGTTVYIHKFNQQLNMTYSIQESTATDEKQH